MIVIETHIEELGEDPSIKTYCVTVSSETGVWKERFGTTDLSDAFIRGVRALESFVDTTVIFKARE